MRKSNQTHPEQKVIIKMRKDMIGAEKRIGKHVTVGHSKDGSTEVIMDGAHHIRKIEIDPDWDGDKDELCDTLAEAFNDACDQIDHEYDIEMSSIISRYSGKDYD